jgi:hypothetical protein
MSSSQKLCFNSLSSAKWRPCRASFIGPNRRQSEGDILAVSRMGKNSPSHICDCLACAQVGVRPGIVVKEKAVFHVSVRTNCKDTLPQFV